MEQIEYISVRDELKIPERELEEEPLDVIVSLRNLASKAGVGFYLHDVMATIIRKGEKSALVRAILMHGILIEFSLHKIEDKEKSEWKLVSITFYKI